MGPPPAEKHTHIHIYIHTCAYPNPLSFPISSTASINADFSAVTSIFFHPSISHLSLLLNLCHVLSVSGDSDRVVCRVIFLGSAFFSFACYRCSLSLYKMNYCGNTKISPDFNLNFLGSENKGNKHTVKQYFAKVMSTEGQRYAKSKLCVQLLNKIWWSHEMCFK